MVDILLRNRKTEFFEIHTKKPASTIGEKKGSVSMIRYMIVDDEVLNLPSLMRETQPSSLARETCLSGWQIDA